MDTQKRIEELESAIIDVLDGCHEWYEIREGTGLSEERCREISELYYATLKIYRNRHGIRNVGYPDTWTS